MDRRLQRLGDTDFSASIAEPRAVTLLADREHASMRLHKAARWSPPHTIPWQDWVAAVTASSTIDTVTIARPRHPRVRLIDVAAAIVIAVILAVFLGAITVGQTR